VKLRREASTLKVKAVSSLRRAVRAFNDYDDDGRVCTTLLHLQHSFEMLMKAALVQQGHTVMDPRDGKSIGFAKCVNLSTQHLGVTQEQAGALRAIDALRDDEQHWMTELSEALLYVHCRAGTTMFDDFLSRWFDDSLAAHLPHRVLPISAEPPRDLQLLLDREYSHIVELLKPGQRKRPDARARIRGLLALEAHAREDALVSKQDVDRVEKAIRSGGQRQQVFPALSDVGISTTGEGVQVQVRFVKTGGAPVRLAGPEEVTAGAVRQVDLQNKYHWTKTQLGERFNLDSGRCKALRWFLGVDDEEDCRHDFVFGSQVHRQYSDNAFTRMRDGLASVDIAAVYAEYLAHDRGRQPRGSAQSSVA
jgi:hypothetical protein